LRLACRLESSAFELENTVCKLESEAYELENDDCSAVAMNEWSERSGIVDIFQMRVEHACLQLAGWRTG
jgi:transcription-repair coupling factor (superfamily II helicase)